CRAHGFRQGERDREGPAAEGVRRGGDYPPAPLRERLLENVEIVEGERRFLRDASENDRLALAGAVRVIIHRAALLVVEDPVVAVACFLSEAECGSLEVARLPDLLEGGAQKRDRVEPAFEIDDLVRMGTVGLDVEDEDVPALA